MEQTIRDKEKHLEGLQTELRNAQHEKEKATIELKRTQNLLIDTENQLMKARSTAPRPVESYSPAPRPAEAPDRSRFSCESFGVSAQRQRELDRNRSSEGTNTQLTVDFILGQMRMQDVKPYSANWSREDVIFVCKKFHKDGQVSPPNSSSSTRSPSWCRTLKASAPTASESAGAGSGTYCMTSSIARTLLGRPLRTHSAWMNLLDHQWQARLLLPSKLPKSSKPRRLRRPRWAPLSATLFPRAKLARGTNNPAHILC